MSGQGRDYSCGSEGSEGSGDMGPSSGSQDGAQELAISKPTSSSAHVLPGASWGHSLRRQATLVGHTHMEVGQGPEWGGPASAERGALGG